jgi:RNA polymerase sigma-70 factor (ECF subfamily)
MLPQEEDEMQTTLLGAAVATEMGKGLSDEALVARIRAGEERYFEVLMRRHNARLFRAARAIVKDDDLAEEVMQDAYVACFTHLDQFEGRSSLSTWLTRIAINEALGRRKRSMREPTADWTESDEQVLDEGSDPRLLDDPEVAAHRGQIREILTQVVDSLPENLRTAFVLREVEGMSVADVAACLDLSEENVKQRVFRARGALRKKLERTFDGAVTDLFGFHLVRCDRVVTAVLRRIAQDMN